MAFQAVTGRPPGEWASQPQLAVVMAAVLAREATCIFRHPKEVTEPS